MFKQTLFIWIKTPLLSHSNGFYCVHASQVVNAGSQHMKEMNKLAGIAPVDGAFEVQANLDRQLRDSTVRNALVLIKSGIMKGLKGTVIHANESQAYVDVHCKGTRVMIDRQDIELVIGNRGGIYIQQNADMPMQLSFDEAANREYVNTMADDGVQKGPSHDYQFKDDDDDGGDKTPVRALDDD